MGEQLYATLCSQLISALQGSKIGLLNTSSRELTKNLRITGSAKRHNSQNKKKENLCSQLITILTNQEDSITITSTSFPAHIRSNNIGVKMDFIGTLLGVKINTNSAMNIITQLIRTDPCNVTSACGKNKDAILGQFYKANFKEALVLIEILLLTKHIMTDPCLLEFLKHLDLSHLKQKEQKNTPLNSSTDKATTSQRDEFKPLSRAQEATEKPLIELCNDYLSYIYCDKKTKLTDSINKHLNALVDLLVTNPNTTYAVNPTELSFCHRTEKTNDYHETRADILLSDIREITNAWELLKIKKHEEDTSKQTLPDSICTNWRLTGALILIIGRWFKITLDQSPHSLLTQTQQKAILDVLEMNIKEMQKNKRHLRQLNEQQKKATSNHNKTFYLPRKLNIVFTEHFTCHLNSIKKSFYERFDTTCKQILNTISTALTKPLMNTLSTFLTKL